MLRRRHIRRLLADRDAARGRHWHLASGVAGTRLANGTVMHPGAPFIPSPRQRHCRSLQPLQVLSKPPLTTTVAKNA
jgi:hypothetical protein